MKVQYGRDTMPGKNVNIVFHVKHMKTFSKIYSFANLKEKQKQNKTKVHSEHFHNDPQNQVQWKQIYLHILGFLRREILHNPSTVYNSRHRESQPTILENDFAAQAV